MHTIGEKRIRMLNPRDIKRPQVSVRRTMDEEELSLLRDSIAASGIIQPLIVKKQKRGVYQLISGQRRLQAALMAGLRRVPCVVHNVNDCDAIVYALTENIQSRPITPFEAADAINLLISKKRMTLSETAARLGVSQSSVAAKLQILRLDSRLAQRISAAGLSEEHARALLRLPREGRAQALDTIISEGFSAKQAEKYIFSILNPPLNKQNEPDAQLKEKPIRKVSIGDLRIFSNSLFKMVDTLKNGGIKATVKKIENSKYSEYRIRIKKEPAVEEEFAQMQICP